MQNLIDIEQWLEVLRNQVPLVLGHLVTVELLQCIDRSSRDLRVKDGVLVQLSAVERLVSALYLDGY